MKAEDVKVGMVLKIDSESPSFVKVISKIGKSGMLWVSPFANGLLQEGDTICRSAENLRPLTKRERGGLTK